MVGNEEQKMIFKQKGMDPYYKIWHTTGKNMIFYIYSGTGSIVTGEQNYPIVPGCLCFIGADKFHYTLPEVDIETGGFCTEGGSIYQSTYCRGVGYKSNLCSGSYEQVPFLQKV